MDYNRTAARGGGVRKKKIRGRRYGRKKGPGVGGALYKSREGKKGSRRSACKIAPNEKSEESVKSQGKLCQASAGDGW